jgi:type IV pilus assembly protein PilC
MAVFSYSAKAKDNKIRTGKIDASNRSEAKAYLRKRGLKIISLTEDISSKLFEGEISVIGEFLIKDEKNNYQILIGSNPPKIKDVIIFTRQMATMIRSGIPLIQSMRILEKQQKSRGFRRALYDIRERVENGASFSSTLALYPHIFDTLYVAMVESGEISGNLDEIMTKLVIYIEKAEKIKSQVKSALAYPAIVVVVAIAVITCLLAFVVPVFAQQFAETGTKLPDLTQFVIDFSNYFLENWYIIFGCIGSAIYGFIVWKKTPNGRRVFDKYILRFPIIGDVLKKIAVGRFCSTMASMLSSGVNLLQALSICAASSGNKVIEDFILNVKFSLEKGENFSTPLSQGNLFPSMVISMVEVGESTGSLDAMLTKVSEFYEEEVDLAVKTMLSMIEPIMIVCIGGIVSFVVVAMYLPIFEVAGSIG